MDVDRIRYAINKYHRTRLLKIEEALEFILSNVDILDRLSNSEKIFATKLNTLNNNYLEDALLNNLHHELRDFIESSDDRFKHAEPQVNVSYLLCVCVCVCVFVSMSAY